MLTSYFVMSVTMTFVLFLIFGYFYIAQEEKALGIWSMAWFVSALRQLINEWLKMQNTLNSVIFINDILVVLCAILFILGTYYFINRKPRLKWGLIFVVTSLWSITAVKHNFYFIYRIIPLILLLLYAYLKTGLIFLSDNNNHISNKVLGFSFIGGGLNTIAYVILSSIPNIVVKTSPWIYILNFFIAIIMAVSLLDVNFRKQINQLKLSEEHLKKAILDLQESEDHNNKIFDLLPSAIYIYKGEELVTVNSSALEIMQCEDAERKEQLLINIHTDYVDEINEKFDRLKENETTESFSEVKMILHNGNIIDVEIGGVSYVHNGEMYVVKIIRDLNERKSADRLKSELIKANELEQFRTQFFTNISHDLKTPLNIILSSIQLISHMHADVEGCSLYQPCNNYTLMMKQNCYRLLKLINDLLDVTKLDSGALSFVLKNYDIVRIVEDTTLSVVDYANSLGIKLIFDTDIEEKIITCDPDKIERVILNLLSNAIKFTEQGGLITVSIMDNYEYIVISVRDTGIGIPEDKMEYIFERFGQVKSSLIRNKEGSGIGLTLVKSFVEYHGGFITVESELGKGSEFFVHLPTKLTSDEFIYIDENEEINAERLLIELADI